VSARNPKSRADCLEALKRELREVRIFSQSQKDGYFPYVASAIKKYICGHSAIVIGKSCTKPCSRNHQLLLLRVPPSANRSIVAEDLYLHTGKLCGSSNSETDAVLVVRHLGYVANKVIAASRAWRSSVWLLPHDFVDKDLGQSGVPILLPSADDASNTTGCIRPRVVFVEAEATERQSSSRQGSVKRVLKVNESIPDVSFDTLRQRCSEANFKNPLAGLKVVLDHRSERAVTYVEPESVFSRCYTRLCPIDLILNRIENTHG
jgi:hypothetical protein